jgi:hypothetical protein
MWFSKTKKLLCHFYTLRIIFFSLVNQALK